MWEAIHNNQRRRKQVVIALKIAESSLETKAMKIRYREHKINKNEGTLSERIVLIFRILIQIF